MSEKPVLLFLHGVGDGDPHSNWKKSLNKSLTGLEYPNLDGVEVVAPNYANELLPHFVDSLSNVELPPITATPLRGDAAKLNRRAFEKRMAGLEYRLGLNEAGTGHILATSVIDLALLHGTFNSVRNYMNEPKIRARVLKKILSVVPENGRITIVAHSLGSVIAADLLSRLPQGIEVTGMVTIGSPLAHGKFNVDNLRNAMKEPPVNVAWWVNFWNTWDPVAAHRGVSSVFPWMIDKRISSQIDLHVHAASQYFADFSVAEAIGFALFGSTNKELVHVPSGSDIPLDHTELLTVTALRYAHHVLSKLEGDIKDRAAGALRQVQANAILSIVQRNSEAEVQRPIPAQIARLAFDLADPEALAPEPLPVHGLTKDKAAILLAVLAEQNVFHPFEISFKKLKQDVRGEALLDLSVEMGFKSCLGSAVLAASKQARDILRGDRDVNWLKWGAMGVGAAALVFATGGLVLAAGAGLAGAAAVTSALATFGPGGMVGGLVTAGALVSAGSSGIMYGMASPSTSAEAVELIVCRQLTMAILRQKQELNQDPSLWSNLVATEMEVRREHERLDEFSDSSSPMIKDLQRKIIAVERALKYLSDNDLEPGSDLVRDEDEPEGEARRRSRFMPQLKLGS